MRKLTTLEAFWIMLAVIGLTTVIAFSWIPGAFLFAVAGLGLVVNGFES